MATTTHDDGFHEIQLNGKQLVFLFMAVTVVSVVIFLSGVLVGRGVRMDGPAAVTEVSATNEAGDAAPPIPTLTDGQPITQGNYSELSKLANNTPSGDKLQPAEEPSPKPEPVAEGAKESAPPVTATEPQAPAAATNEPPAAEKKSAEKGEPATPAAGIPAPPLGPGLEIQLSAFRDRKGADALASRVTAMGFSAYVVPPGPGAPALFRVRVGKFKERREAEAVANKLKKEKFKPWILP